MLQLIFDNFVDFLKFLKEKIIVDKLSHGYKHITLKIEGYTHICYGESQYGIFFMCSYINYRILSRF